MYMLHSPYSVSLAPRVGPSVSNSVIVEPQNTLLCVCDIVRKLSDVIFEQVMLPVEISYVWLLIISLLNCCILSIRNLMPFA